MSNISGSDRMSYIKTIYLLYPDHNPGRYYIVYFCQKIQQSETWMNS